MRGFILAFSASLAIGAIGCAESGPGKAPVGGPPAGVPVSQDGFSTVTGRAERGTVVSLVPLYAELPPAPAEPLIMDQRGQQFLPALLVARVGQPVEFRNGEGIAHNVYVTSATGSAVELNVSTDPFQAHTHVFQKAGAFHVSCDIHPSMYASIVAVESPYTSVAGDFGGYQIMNVPPGAYRLVTIAGDATSQRQLEVIGAHVAVDAAPR